jgi:hypothetical protein
MRGARVPDWLQPLIGPLGLLLGVAIAVLGTRYAARSSARAAARTADVASRQVDVGEWQAIVEALRTEVERLSGRVESLEADRTLERAAHRALLTYTRGLLAWIHRNVPGATPPMPPTAFVDELAYITER